MKHEDLWKRILCSKPQPGPGGCPRPLVIQGCSDLDAPPPPSALCDTTIGPDLWVSTGRRRAQWETALFPLEGRTANLEHGIMLALDANAADAEVSHARICAALRDYVDHGALAACVRALRLLGAQTGPREPIAWPAETEPQAEPNPPPLSPDPDDPPRARGKRTRTPYPW